MRAQPSFFEPIRQRASLRWDQLERDPELAGPWHQLFKQVQSPRHVLSELLQNADDAGATEAFVRIEDRAFIFSHNGEDFSKEHFESLCRFGYSNKRALHTIGFRGIGFKSTFSLGDTVELETPTLSVAFTRKRFTEPKWVGSNRKSDGLTQIRVAIGDAHRQREVEKNLQEWVESAVSLLFFKSIRQLRIGDETMFWTRIGPGPVPKTQWMALKSTPDKKYLVAQSAAEAFPDEALSEIRDERLLGGDQVIDLPPCKVEIVLGEDGRLYVVLPTGVRTTLPFASNAPFIQDPARLKIKDPETSPTNRWLLERIGSLAATVMLQWLEKDSLDLPTRSLAYSLYPDDNGGLYSSERASSKIITDAFDAVIEKKDVLLTNHGKLKPAGQCVVVPEELIGVWPEGKSANLLDPEGRPSFSRHVPEDICERLIQSHLVQRISRDDVLAILREKKLPRPATWGKLLALWSYVESEITKDRYYGKFKDVQILPVQGKDELYSAGDIVRLGEKRLLQSDADWDYLATHLLVLNQNWSRFLAEQRRDADVSNDGKAKLMVDSAYAILHAMDLESSSDVSDVVERVAQNFFSRDTADLKDCIRIAQIAAKLGVTVGEKFMYATRKGELRGKSDAIVYDGDGTLEPFFPAEWGSEHFLHSDYVKSFRSCSAEEWRQWVSSGKAGLRTFAPFAKKERNVWGRKKLEGELRSLGLLASPIYSYKTEDYVIQDFDFEKSHWEHWSRLADTDSALWFRVMDRILSQPADSWMEVIGARIIQVAKNGNWKPLAETVPPAWILKFRDLRCLQDSRGLYRKPADLLRRTPETEALMDVEPFIHGRLDVEGTRPLLEMLGVRGSPTGPDRLLASLRALAGSEDPPIQEVEKWYRRLDLMLDTCSTQDSAKIKAAFREEKIILTEGAGWAAAAGVFLSADEVDVPGAAVIRSSVSDLALWRKIGIADHPTADLAIQWLVELPSGAALSQDDLRRVQALLRRHAHRIWNECGHWTNLAGEWVPIDALEYAISMQSLVPWSHLHDWVKQKTADLQRLSAEVTESAPFSNLTHLAAQIEDRFHHQPHFKDDATRELWLNRFGAVLCRIELEGEEETARLRSLANELAETVWQAAPGLEIVPYINGTPAGTPRRAEIVWLNRVLYVDKLPKARLASLVPDRLGKSFGRADVTAALNYCFGRSSEEVSEYLEENFKLAARGTLSSGTSETDSPVEVPSNNGIGLSGPAGDPAVNAEADDLDLPEAEGPNGDPVEPESGKVNPPNVRAHPRSVKPCIMERYARSRGFRKTGNDHFVHPDGYRIVSEPGDLFPWVRRTAGGEIIGHYWAKDHCLELEPLQIEAEVWALIDSSPGSYALVLASPQGDPVEVPGARILAMRDGGKLTLYPATYRLVYSDQDG